MGRLRVPYRDELILAYEARVADQTSLELLVREEATSTTRSRTPATTTPGRGETASRPNLDDPSTWTDEGGCTGSVRANLDGLERNYEAIILRAAVAGAAVVPPGRELHLLQDAGQQQLLLSRTPGSGPGWNGFPGQRLRLLSRPISSTATAEPGR